MRPTPRNVLLASVVVLAGAWGFVRISAVGAQEALQSAKSARGGLLAKTTRHQFEVFFFPTGVRVLAETAAGQPVDVSRATGTATFYHPNSPQPWFSRTLRGTGQTPASLELPIGLGNAPATGGKVTFELSGLPDPSEPTASFTIPLEFVATHPASSSATVHPAPPHGGTATVPRYVVYRPGSSDYGYYPYSSPTPASPPASSYYGYSTPSRHFSGDGDSVGPGHRDWSTGRDSPLAKPWMRPID
jgi:hypothetical protein